MPRLKRFLRLLTVALLSIWLIMIGYMSYRLIDALMNPLCLPNSPALEGYFPRQITTADGVTLDAWWRPPRNGAVILLLPGYGGSRDTLLPEANILANAGYGILTSEMRCMPKAPSTLGYREVEEFRAMTKIAAAQPGVNWIGALGLSMGGVAIVRAAPDLPQIRAMVVEGNFANLYNEMIAEPVTPLSPRWQVRRLVALFYGLRVGVWPGSVSPIDDLPRLAPRPLLLIYGDQEAERLQAQAQYAAAGPHAELWIVPNAGHGAYRDAPGQPPTYANRIVNFFELARKNESQK